MQYMTPGEAAERLQVSRWTVLRWIEEGRFSGVIRAGFSRNSPHKIPEPSVEELADELGVLPPNGNANGKVI